MFKIKHVIQISLFILSLLLRSDCMKDNVFSVSSYENPVKEPV